MEIHKRNLLFPKYSDPHHESICRLLCAILRDLDVQHPECSQYDQATIERLRDLSENDWLLLERMAEAERVAPLIYWAVKYSDGLRSVFDPDTFALVQTAYYASAARNAVIIQELERILKILAEASIPVIVLKGAALAQTIYPDIGLRPMNDLDLLVQPIHVDRVIELIKNLEYQRLPFTLNDVFEDQIEHAVRFVSETKPKIEVEVHWRLASSETSLSQPPMDWFWQNMATVHFRGSDLYILSNSAHLLYLCAHLGLQHGIGLSSLIWFMDIYLLSLQAGETIDWNEFIRQASVSGWSASACFVLQAAAEYLDLKIDPDLFSQLRSQMKPQESNVVMAKSLVGQNRAYSGLTNLMGLRWTMRIKLVFGYLFPSRNYMRLRYQARSSWLLPFYYPYRWWDMACKVIAAFRIKGSIKVHL